MTDEMIDHFEERTSLHISNVRHFLDRIIRASDDDIVKGTCMNEYIDHDSSKFEQPEYSPYVLLTWRYKMREDGVKSFDFSIDIQDEITQATVHHIKNNKHHPEYWIPNKDSMQLINPNDRDKPLNKVLDVTEMPDEYICCMVADWMAMSLEKGTSPFDWADKNVNVRWKFNDHQVSLIYAILERFWEN